MRRGSWPIKSGAKLSSITLATASGALTTAALLLITGIALWPFGAGGLWRAAHRWLTLLVLIPIAGHVFLAVIFPSTRQGLTGMLDGRVDREWAATHHPRWEPK